jgi:hypothetical protein
MLSFYLTIKTSLLFKLYLVTQVSEYLLIRLYLRKRSAYLALFI